MLKNIFVARLKSLFDKKAQLKRTKVSPSSANDNSTDIQKELTIFHLNEGNL